MKMDDKSGTAQNLGLVLPYIIVIMGPAKPSTTDTALCRLVWLYETTVSLYQECLHKIVWQSI